jgi:hypothetical protein
MKIGQSVLIIYCLLVVGEKKNNDNQNLLISWVHPPVLYQSTKSAFTDKMHDNMNHASEKTQGKYLFHLAQSDTYILLKLVQII